MNHSINPTKMYEGIPLRLVPHEPDNGYQFYVAHDGKIGDITAGLRIAPDGVETIITSTFTTTENCKNQTDANRVQRYLSFRHAWGFNEGILVSHAVYRAWSEQSMPLYRLPLYHQVHHLNGITTDNNFDNLLCIGIREHRTVADARQAALKELYPDLRTFSYAELRVIQDPHITTDEEFAQMMVKYEQLYEQEHGPLFKRFDALYRSTVLRSTRITREERARAKAVWDHMTPDQRTTIMLRMNAGVGITERMDYTLSSFISHN